METQNKLGWLVIEDTTRDGCDTSGVQQYWEKGDAEREAKRLRDLRPDDDCYIVVVRRETADDADQYGRYI